MKRVLFVWADPRARIDQKVFTGSTSHVFNLLNALKHRGCQVTSIIPGENSLEKQTQNAFRRIKTRIPSRLSSWMRDAYEIFYDYQFKKRYEHIFNKGSHDLIYERLTYFHQSCSQFAERLITPYIVEIHSTVEARKWLGNYHFPKLAESIQRKVLERADAIIVMSSVLREIYIQKGISPEKIHVVPNAVDELLFNPEKDGGRDIRNEKDLAGKTVIGHVSSMKQYHGIDLLLQAMRIVKEKSNNSHLLLVGPFDPSLTSIYQDGFMTVTNAVSYQEIPRWVDSMDICIVSILETRGSPIKIFEYGAMAKPVIAPDLPAIRELLRHMETAYLFRPGDPKSLAEAILQLIHAPELAIKLGMNLREKILMEHTWKRNAERILDIYEDIKGRRASSDGR